jgi:uncharacterized protein YigA (DUF484 family)
MNGYTSPVTPPSLEPHAGEKGNHPHDSRDLIAVGSDESGVNTLDYASRWAAAMTPAEDDPSDVSMDDNNEELLRSFDMIFQLHQRSEETRRRLDQIDRALLSSRTVVGLLETVTQTLQKDMDLVAVRFLFKEDHALASAFEVHEPENTGLIPRALLEHASLFHGDPYILDDPSGELGEILFGDAAAQVASAVVVTLDAHAEELGLLCLGSDDPCRYCGGMNTELITALADKISLGLQNAWDHEIRVRQALMGDVQGVYSEAFLKEYLKKEFQRSWRTYRTFSLMAVAWGFSYAMESQVEPDLVSLITSNLRAADVVAEGETVNLWVLLPDTDLQGARTAADRIVKRIGENAGSSAQIFIGVTAFSRDAVTTHKLMRQARIALGEAIDADRDRVVAMPVELG